MSQLNDYDIAYDDLDTGELDGEGTSGGEGTLDWHVNKLCPFS